ncbi:DEKNAAC102267 [Brettanomyces naardenensis]|uniref:DEKNAAC102267 n=1 Tax=Brettanomyces naardenensis TaxID=13370 RepID=A0A448YLC7_BRENA|nr:DEKNAAC102267 [Brettanomyces naardenensis]
MSFRVTTRQTVQGFRRFLTVDSKRTIQLVPLAKQACRSSVRSLSTLNVAKNGRFLVGYNRASYSVFNVPSKQQYVRYYSVIEEESSAPVIDFAKMTEIVTEKDPAYVVVDVREPDEFAEGHIPGSINIPCKSSPGAFGLQPEEFRLTFGFDKPATDKTLVFYCLGGIRSSISEELAGTCDYSKRLNYKGSWEDWVANRGAVEFPPPEQKKDEGKAENKPEEAEPKKEETEKK